MNVVCGYCQTPYQVEINQAHPVTCPRCGAEDAQDIVKAHQPEIFFCLNCLRTTEQAMCTTCGLETQTQEN